ncbi:signal recognition particle subunit SRP68 [Aspergillus mulundensis]|uniref:Signal recognition particle subunit SRP68 n=1 Tax=Aspergillus mulundensis TaxID=1810919 RepID=A0A3D8T6B1_9EURO|nr:Signal recognition particle subunit SRP68 [Aspergillus mulundensis]RDW93548.1 Signal recognition particle subunit SRP68 [Aspergillus mulundensis]
MEITEYIFARREEVLIAGDYNAYRAHTTRRLHNIRKKLGQTTPKGRKYTTKPPISAEDVSQNVANVHLLLLSAERAWAQAMHMKSTHSADPSAKGISGASRRHIISRLSKAAGYANQLVGLLEDKSGSGATDTDILEARAYLSSLLGASYLEKRNWEQCVRSYSVSRVIYSALGQAAKKDAFRDLLSGNIDPSLRYAAYQMKLPRTKPIPSLAIEYFPVDSGIRSEVEKADPNCLKEDAAGTRRTADGQVHELPETVTWRSRTVTLEDAVISQALAAASAEESRLAAWLNAEGSSASSKDKAAAYDSVIIASQDAVDATKTAIDDLANEGVDPGDKRMQSLQITRTAVNYALVGWRTGRNRVLCGEKDGIAFEPGRMHSSKNKKTTAEQDAPSGKKLTWLRERVVLCDSTLQSIEFILELPGVAADSDFVRELEVKRNYFRALRSLAIGRSHALLGKSQNALALFSQALSLVSETAASIQSTTTTAMDIDGPPRLDISPAQVSSLEHELRALVTKYQGLVTLESISAQEQSSNKSTIQRPLVERLHEYAGDSLDLDNLVPFPPEISPIPVKPLFLDVAWNYIGYPREGKAAVSSAQAQAQGEPAAQENKGGKRGWFGFGR